MEESIYYCAECRSEPVDNLGDYCEECASRFAHAMKRPEQEKFIRCEDCGELD